MSRFVLDSSAVLAVLLQEQGYAKAAELNPGGRMSSVNLTEILSKCLDFGYPQDAALGYLEASSITVLAFDAELAGIAAMLRRRSRKLSLGDRACIALAIHEEATALTAERIWADIDLGCPVELIR